MDLKSLVDDVGGVKRLPLYHVSLSKPLTHGLNICLPFTRVMKKHRRFGFLHAKQVMRKVK